MTSNPLNPATMDWIRKTLIQHSCTGGVPCRPSPPSGTKGQVQSTKDREQLRADIEALDLDCVKFKLMHPTEGEAWPREQADRVEVLYKRFLFMAVSDPRPFMPTSEVDEMWHTHILDTAKYAEDCEAVFGFFLHHFPYFGLRGDEDVLNMVRLFMDTCRRYEEEYGEPYADVPPEFLQIPELQESIDFSSPELVAQTERPSLAAITA